jgi:hypothetical protein
MSRVGKAAGVEAHKVDLPVRTNHGDSLGFHDSRVAKTRRIPPTGCCRQQLICGTMPSMARALKKKSLLFRGIHIPIFEKIAVWFGAYVALAILLGALYLAIAAVFPTVDVKLSSESTSVYDGQLFFDGASLQNSGPFGLKDPEIACEAKGQSGTTIQDFKITIYESVPQAKTILLPSQRLGKLPDQTDHVTCRLADIHHQW